MKMTPEMYIERAALESVGYEFHEPTPELAESAKRFEEAREE